MKKLLVYLIVLCKYGAQSLNLPGPLVYVVTPAPKPQTDEGRSAPFYYNNWVRRMDSPKNATTTTTYTPDLIFAEFESGNKIKSIRKLLEKEKIEITSSTTSRPIYVPDETNVVSQDGLYGLPVPTDVKKEVEKSTTPDMTDYFALYNNMYNVDSAPVYMPSTTSSTTTTTTPDTNIQNIWHIIDSQKHDKYSGKWEEVANEEVKQTTEKMHDENKSEEELDENFALPGFGPNPGNGGENESRAIRTEPNIRFPYVNLKPFQMKTHKRPALNTISNSKKGNNMFTSLDDFRDIKNPVRGEAQDVVPMMRQPIERYNPAQPYLPQPEYGSKSKQSMPSSNPMKVVANLVPPPPRITDNDFPAPTSYESFPPYAPIGPPSAPVRPPPSAPARPPPSAPKPSVMFQPPTDSSDDSGSDSTPDDDGPPMDVGYRYKAPPPAQPFLPTVPPVSKPFSGYSYAKPQMLDDSPPAGGYSYDKPPMADTPDDEDKQAFQGYYNKPQYSAPPQDSGYGHDSHSYGPDYPELIFDKPHKMKGGDDMKDMGMAPPPPPDMKPDMDHGPENDHGFPADFPGDLKFNHDFDHDHDYPHYHHHHPTTTTTTETPRVNRYSYYYLGKKLYYLPLYFSVYFIVYVGALIIKAVLRHKIVYPNSWRPNDQTAGFFSKRSVDSYDLSNENLHEITGKVTRAIALAGEKYFSQKKKT